MPLLAIEQLTTEYETDAGVVRAVDGLDLRVEAGETLCLVGESGSGKSTVALSVMGLLPAGVGRVVAGRALFDDGGGARDLFALPEAARARLRGRRMAMVFQDPMTALNPYLTVGAQLEEVLVVHDGASRAEARRAALAMLREVGIPAPESRLDEHPHRLSGGMRQRVLLGMALLCRPRLLFADEPTSALDVTVQAQILELLRRERDAVGCGVVLVTHDLGVVARAADRVAVMYAGRVVEAGPVRAVLGAPRHPYTRGLLRAVPRPELGTAPLEPIAGAPPPAHARPSGCAFHPRCPYAEARCRSEAPEEREVGAAGVRLRCHLEEGAP